MSEPTPAIPKGSTVLVTGLTGFIASHIGKQLLDRGYKVRGTVRDLSAASWLTSELFSTHHQAGHLELTQVPDLGAPHAFDDVLKGVAAILHVATVMSLDPDPHNVIPATVDGVMSLLRAAASERSISRFAYTSSAGAAFMPMPGAQGRVDRDSWNDMAVQAAWAPPPYEPSRAFATYMASKAEAEKAVWRFVEEQKPGFVTNVVSPFTALGPVLHKKHTNGTAGWVDQLWRGDTSQISALLALIYVNVKDVAALHVAALIDPEIKDQRIQAWAVPFNWNDILAILRRIYPKHQLIGDLPEMGKISTTADDSVARLLLKRWSQQDDWISLEAGVRETVDSIAALGKSA